LPEKYSHRKLSHKVSPRSHKSIESIAVDIRKLMDIQKPYISIEKVYAVLQDCGALDFDIVEDSELGENMAEAYPDKRLILIRESVYDNACRGDPRSRFTMAHELGHLILHIGQAPSKGFARGNEPSHKIFEDCEWQADKFASTFLMNSSDITTDMTKEDIACKFGTSLSSAQLRLKGIIKERA
jgi:Zn-dependent peptidase ImmA (M78 family)